MHDSLLHSLTYAPRGLEPVFAARLLRLDNLSETGVPPRFPRLPTRRREGDAFCQEPMVCEAEQRMIIWANDSHSSWNFVGAASRTLSGRALSMFTNHTAEQSFAKATALCRFWWTVPFGAKRSHFCSFQLLPSLKRNRSVFLRSSCNYDFFFEVHLLPFAVSFTKEGPQSFLM